MHQRVITCTPRLATLGPDDTIDRTSSDVKPSGRFDELGCVEYGDYYAHGRSLLLRE